MFHLPLCPSMHVGGMSGADGGKEAIGRREGRGGDRAQGGARRRRQRHGGAGKARPSMCGQGMTYEGEQEGRTRESRKELSVAFQGTLLAASPGAMWNSRPFTVSRALTAKLKCAPTPLPMPAPPSACTGLLPAPPPACMLGGREEEGW
ncbi:unnamed protein product [Closterium sp. NIES-53]